MLLTIDIGNTNVTLGLYKGNILVRIGDLPRIMHACLTNMAYSSRDFYKMRAHVSRI